MLQHYERQTDDALAEDEALPPSGDVMMHIPNSLVPAVRDLVGQHQQKQRGTAPTRAKHKSG